LQKWIAETVRSLPLIGGAEKMAAMQSYLQKKCRKRDKNCTDIVQVRHEQARMQWIDTDNPCGKGVRIIRFHPPYPPNSRSIPGVQKNGTDAENRANGGQNRER